MRGRLTFALFLAVFAIHASSPNVMIADSARALYVSISIVHERDIDLTEYLDLHHGDPFALETHHGDVYPVFPWGPSLFAVPAVVATDVVQAVRDEPDIDELIDTPGSTWPWELISMSLVVAMTTVVLYWVALRVLEPGRRRRLLAWVAVATFALATPAWSTASRSLWQHGPSMLFLSIALLLSLKAEEDDRSIPWLGVALAMGFVMRPTNAIPAALFSVWVLLRHRRRLLAYAAGVLAVAVPFCAVNVVSYGSLLPWYYGSGRLARGEDEREVQFLEALLGHLVSPSRGLFVFTPVLLLAFVGVVLKWRARRFAPLDWVLVGSVVLHWIAISTISHWWGGHSYGPRLFSDMVPFLIVLSLPVLDRVAHSEVGTAGQRLGVTACSVLLLASVAVHIQGAYLRSSWCWNADPVDVDRDEDRLWDWSDPQLARGARRVLDGSEHELTRAGVIKIGC